MPVGFEPKTTSTWCKIMTSWLMWLRKTECACIAYYSTSIWLLHSGLVGIITSISGLGGSRRPAGWGAGRSPTPHAPAFASRAPHCASRWSPCTSLTATARTPAHAQLMRPSGGDTECKQQPRRECTGRPTNPGEHVLAGRLHLYEPGGGSATAASAICRTRSMLSTAADPNTRASLAAPRVNHRHPAAHVLAGRRV